MTKEKNNVVEAVREVIGSIELKEQRGDKITKNDLAVLIKSVNDLITDYEATIDNLNASSSLVVKYEKFIEVIGIMEYISVENAEVLDESLVFLNRLVSSVKQK